MGDLATSARRLGGCPCCAAARPAVTPVPSITPTPLARRTFLAGLGATGLGAAAATRIGTSRAAASRRLIDVHSHFIPPFYLAQNRDRIAGSRGGEISRAWLEWNPQQSLDAMDTHGVTTAMLSLSTPGSGSVMQRRRAPSPAR